MQLAEANEQRLQAGEVGGRAAAHPLQGVPDLRALHQPPGQRAVQRRQGEGAVFHHLDEDAAGAEQDHRPELAVHRTADDQLDALVADHRLHRDAGERLAAWRPCRTFMRISIERGPHPGFVGRC